MRLRQLVLPFMLAEQVTRESSRWTWKRRARAIPIWKRKTTSLRKSKHWNLAQRSERLSTKFGGSEAAVGPVSIASRCCRSTVLDLLDEQCSATLHCPGITLQISSRAKILSSVAVYTAFSWKHRASSFAFPSDASYTFQHLWICSYNNMPSSLKIHTMVSWTASGGRTR